MKTEKQIISEALSLYIQDNLRFYTCCLVIQGDQNVPTKVKNHKLQEANHFCKLISKAQRIRKKIEEQGLEWKENKQ